MTSHEMGGTRHEAPSEHTEGLVDVNYDTIDVPEWFIEPGEEYGYKPWQHTPLDPYNEAVRPHQAALYSAFQRLATEPIPPDMDPALAHLVHLDFMAGNARRQMECQSNFEHWKQNYREEYDLIMGNEELAWLLGEAAIGLANPASLLKLLAAAPSLRSLDLQVLTTPFGYRRHNIPAMRAELEETVEGIGGELLDVPLATHAAKIAVHKMYDAEGEETEGRGLIVTQKRLIGGYTPRDYDPIYIMERQAYVVRTDTESGFAPEILKLIKTTPPKDPLYEKIQRYVGERIEKNTGVIPTSTMVYAYRMFEDVKVEAPKYPEIEAARTELALGKAAARSTA